MRAVDEAEVRVRQPRGERLADRGRAHVVASPPPERHRRAHVGELEPPRPSEVRKLTREPQAAVPERLDAAARIRLVRGRIARRRRRQPPPPLEPTRRDARRDARHAHRRTHVALKLGDEIDRRHRADQRNAGHALGSDGGKGERVRPSRRPADRAEAFELESRGSRLRPRAQRRESPCRSAAIDGKQAHAERCRDRVVGVTREPRVAATVQVDDGRPVRVAGLVDD